MPCTIIGQQAISSSGQYWAMVGSGWRKATKTAALHQCLFAFWPRCKTCQLSIRDASLSIWSQARDNVPLRFERQGHTHRSNVATTCWIGNYVVAPMLYLIATVLVKKLPQQVVVHGQSAGHHHLVPTVSAFTGSLKKSDHSMSMVNAYSLARDEQQCLKVYCCRRYLAFRNALQGVVVCCRKNNAHATRPSRQKQQSKQGLHCISAHNEGTESAHHSQRREEPCTSVMTMLTSLDTSPNCSAKPSFRVPGGCLCQSSSNINLMAMKRLAFGPLLSLRLTLVSCALYALQVCRLLLAVCLRLY